MRYNRALLPPADADPHIVAELRRRQDGPICAHCQFCPLDESDLPPLLPGDDAPPVRRGHYREFDCEARGKRFFADGGTGCSRFVRK